MTRPRARLLASRIASRFAAFPGRSFAPLLSVASGRPGRHRLLAAPLGLALATGTVRAEPPAQEQPPLGDYFGFDGIDIMPIGAKAGPAIATDVDGDGLIDLVVVNNRLSRLEILRQKSGASPDDPVPPPTRVNELPDHWRYERSWVPLGHAVFGLAAEDVDGDGETELVYAGVPGSIVVMEQSEAGRFDVVERNGVRGLASLREGFEIADLVGDETPEAVAVVGGRVHVWPFVDGRRLGEAQVLSAGSGSVSAIDVADVDGDGTLDLVAAIPEDPAPLRVWLVGDGPDGRTLGPQLRFEMPPIRRVGAFELPGSDAARLAVLERASKRLAIYELAGDGAEASFGRPSLRYFGFEDPTSRRRLVAVGDVDGDGLEDLVASHVDANEIVLHRQVPGRGFERAESFPAYAELEGLAVADLDGDGRDEVLLQSEKEGVVGVSSWRDGRLTFPRPLALSPGHVPVAVAAATLDRGAQPVVVSREGRDSALDLPGTPLVSVPLPDLGRTPSAIRTLDADGDGRRDLLLLVPDRPMTMLQAVDGEGAEAWRVLGSGDMGQFGLVQAAGGDNTAVFDLDGDGREELLVADRNFIRGVRYDPAPTDDGVAGWQVVDQVNADRSDSRLVSIAFVDDRIVAADRENNRLVVFSRDPDDGWSQSDSIDLEGFRVRSIEGGRFSGGGAEDVLVIADDGFAIVSLDGDRGPVLREVASWRPEEERSLHHDLVAGDLNGDGFTDLAIADAGRQRLDLATFAENGSMLPATGFPIFETKIFSAGEVREFEPHQMLVADVTGDGRSDLVLLCHDRVLVYPQDPGAEAPSP